MDAGELLRGDAPFVAGTSAWWRAATLPSDLGALLQRAVLDGRFWITPIVRMEILYSARTRAEYAALELELDAPRILRNDRTVTDAASSALRELSERGDRYHRIPLADALIAAAAASTAQSPSCTATSLRSPHGRPHLLKHRAPGSVRLTPRPSRRPVG